MRSKEKLLIYFYPLLFLLIYLSTTLLIFQFGPIDYKIHQPIIFWSFLILYHIAFFLGYLVAYKTKKNTDRPLYSFKETGDNINLNFFYIIMILALIASLLSFKKDVSVLDLINPYFWIESAINGIQNLGEVYTAKMERAYNASENKTLNILLFLIAFSKTIIIPFTVFLWNRLSAKIKTVAFFITLLPALLSLSDGTNKGAFDFVILYSSSIAIYFLYRKFKFGTYSLKNRKFFLQLTILSFISVLLVFGSAMSQRGGDLRYVEAFGAHNDIRVTDTALSNQDNFIYYTYAWLSSYIVQGYYGFSLSLNEEFDSTYGVGNSFFIMRNIESLLGVNIRERTFQYKIGGVWDETANWHSFYSHFANDFHFTGVAFVCFFISFLLAKTWFSFIQDGNVFAGSIIPIFAILIIFIPANNQIFGFLDSLSAFIISMCLWWLSKRKFGRKIFIKKSTKGNLCFQKSAY